MCVCACSNGRCCRTCCCFCSLCCCCSCFARTSACAAGAGAWAARAVWLLDVRYSWWASVFTLKCTS
eukprot:scaffold10297_cov54-Phaeocystis_antarctica.AAC.2